MLAPKFFTSLHMLVPVNPNMLNPNFQFLMEHVFLSFLCQSACLIQNFLYLKEFNLVIFVHINRDPPVFSTMRDFVTFTLPFATCAEFF